MPFEIKFTLDGLKDVQRLDGSIKRKLKNALNKKLSTDPLGYGTPLRAPLINYYKHEFATHRIIYRVYPARNLVVICAVEPRKSGDVQDVYEQFNIVVQTGRIAAQIQAVLQNILKDQFLAATASQVSSRPRAYSDTNKSSARRRHPAKTVWNCIYTNLTKRWSSIRWQPAALSAPEQSQIPPGLLLARCDSRHR